MGGVARIPMSLTNTKFSLKSYRRNPIGSRTKSSEKPPFFQGRTVELRGCTHVYSFRNKGLILPRSLTASLPLKNDVWKTILSFWEGLFSGTMLNFGFDKALLKGNPMVTKPGYYLGGGWLISHKE